MKTYKIASEEAVARYGVPVTPDDKPLKVGGSIDLDLTHDEERALLAAGWLETTTKKEK